MRTPPRLLTDTHTLLATTTRTIGTAIRNLTTLAGPWPNTTPGNGNPGSNPGGGHDRIATIAATGFHDPALNALTRIHTLTELAAHQADQHIHRCLGQTPTPPMPAPLQQTVHAYRCARILITLDHLPGAGWGDWHRTADSLYTIVTNHARQPDRPATPTATAPTEDLTGMWCTSCLTVGVRTPRHRRNLCRWCETFHATEGFPPPTAILNARANGTRITEAMVAPHRQAHRDRQRRRVG